MARGDPFAYSDARRAEFEQRAASRLLARALREEPGRDRRQRQAHRRLARRDRARGPRARRRPRPDGGDGAARERRPPRGDRRRRSRGRLRPGADRRLDRDRPARDAESTWRAARRSSGSSPPTSRRLAKRMAQAQSGKRKQRVKAVRRVGELERENVALLRELPRDRRALRPGRGARRDGPLPGDRRGALRPHRSRGRQLPHGDRQPRERDRALRAAATGTRPDRGDWSPPATSTTRASSSTPRRSSTTAPGTCSRRSATTAPPICGGCWPPSGSCACTATIAASSRELARLQTREGDRRGGVPSRGRDGAFADPAAIEAALDEGDLVRDPRRPRATATSSATSSASSPRRLEVDRGLYRTLRPEALATLIYMTARVQRDRRRRGDADRDQRGSRPASTRTRWSGRTRRRRPSTRCTPPATPSTSCASTATTARRGRSSSCSTDCGPSR